MATGYRYQSLDTEHNAIRLLDFHNAFDIHGLKPMSCSMKTVALDDGAQAGPAYSAISYCWGEPPHEYRTMIIDGQEVAVPCNTERVLRYLHVEKQGHLPDSNGEVDLVHSIWIDALCINQSDDAERSRQVALMRKIYATAERVLIWLDEAEQSIAGSALRSIRLVLAQCRVETRNFERLKEVYNTAYTTEPLPNGLDWDAISSLYSLPWFSRLWVVQEAVLARKAIVHFGEVSFDFVDVVRAAVWMLHRSYWRYTARIAGIERCQDMFFLSPDFQGYSLNRHREGKFRLNTRKQFESLEYLLEGIASSRKTSEQRDKVYGVLGLTDEAVRRKVTIDYALPLANVYAMATVAAIEEEQSLHVLSRARALGKASPEWSPDSLWPSWLPRWDLGFDVLHNPRPLLSSWRAAKDHGATVKYSSQAPQTLELSGVVVDSVISVSTWLPYQAQGWSFSEIGDVFCEIWRDYHHLMSADRSPTGQSSEDALCSTLVAGTSDYAYVITDEPGDTHLTYRKRIDDRSGRSFTNLERKGHAMDEDDLDDKFVQDFSDACANRRFFVTKAGRIGLGPRAMFEGDEICILYGGHTPYILQKCQQEHGEPRHVFVGECYVHGIMNGEYIDDLDAQGIREEQTQRFKFI